MIIIDRQPDRVDWDNYVVRHPESLFSHLFGWANAIADVYELPVLRIAARDNLKACSITGVLALVFLHVPGHDSRLISLPYTDGSGLLADSSVIASRLLSEAIKIAHESNAMHLEIRQQGGTLDECISEKFSNHPLSHYRQHRFKIGLSRTLPESGNLLWNNLSSKVRNQVRKAKKEKCHVALGKGELLDHFYSVFSENMRDLGSPVHDRKLFTQVAEELPGHVLVFVVYLNTIPAAASMVLASGNTLFNPWASSIKRFRPQCPNMLLYFAMLEYGSINKFQTFDFGRSSPGAPTCRFKMQWGAMQRPLTWHVLSLTQKRWDPLCESLEDPSWKKVSLEESIRLGPAIRRNISL